jgi:predicted MFS family arabinose efflux permease
MLGGAVFMLGVGVAQPSLYALAADRAPSDRRGSAMATYTMGFQLGGGIGAVVWGITIEHLGYPAMYVGTLVPIAAAVVLVLLRGRPPGSAGPAG